MHPIDPAKVAKFLALWNKEKIVWMELLGTHALMEMSIGTDNSITFQNARGYPIKAFRNMETGEVRMFDARIFAKD